MCRYKCTSRFKCRNTTTTTTIEAFFLFLLLSSSSTFLSHLETQKNLNATFLYSTHVNTFLHPERDPLSRRVCRHAMKKKKKKICNWKRPTLTGQKKNCINALFQRRQKTFNVCFHKRQSTLKTFHEFPPALRIKQ